MIVIVDEKKNHQHDCIWTNHDNQEEVKLEMIYLIQE